MSKVLHDANNDADNTKVIVAKPQVFFENSQATNKRAKTKKNKNSELYYQT